MKASESRLDATLMALAARGDERAFEDLYDRFKGLVYGLVLNIVGDGLTAEDLTVEVFAQVWKHAATYQPHKASVKTWVASIARHRAIDELRRRRIRLDREVPQWAQVPSAELADPDDLETRVEVRDLQSRVTAALASLPVAQREALALAYFRGYSHMRIAETLNRPLGTIKTHIRKAMEQLRGLLRPE